MSEVPVPEPNQNTAGVLPPTRTGPIPRPPGPVQTDVDAGALLSEMREDERY